MKTIRGPVRKQVASDLARDGLGLELLYNGQVVAEVFRCDADHSLTINTFGNVLPLVTMEELIAEARQRLGAFEDGRALPTRASTAA
jgi:hypothetical protein